MRAARIFILLLCAAIGGAATGELLSRWPSSRSLLGRVVGRSGDYVLTVRGTAYFSSDLHDPNAVTAVATEKLRQAASIQPPRGEDVDRELTLLHDQFGDADAFRTAVGRSATNESSLRANIADHLQLRDWIEKQIAPQLTVTEEECRNFYETNRAEFVQPKRYRASHLFVAAPDGTAAEVIAAKRSVAQGLAIRLLAGESFADLAAEASEDESTKTRGGDLGYFAAARMPPEFINEIEKLAVGETSPPFRSHLGFHIVQFTEVKPETALSFEQAQPEIANRLSNNKRFAAVAQLTQNLKSGSLLEPRAVR